MQRILKTAVFIGGAIICSALSSYGQDKPVWADLSFARQSEAWLSSHNDAGLRYIPIDTISQISFLSNFNKGSFINYYQSDNSYNYGTNAESYFRLNPKVVFYGSISYNKFTGKNMGASVWIDPYFAPFNMVEYNDTTRGEKSKETYCLKGATSIDLKKNITIGGSIGYRSANYSKERDLRHLNTLMDLNLSVGLMYQIGKIGQLGVNYYYRKRVEEIEFNTFGNKDLTYNTLISWGTFWGQVESFGLEGFTGKDDNNPLVDKTNGCSVQINTNITPQLRFFNELSLNKREGYFGVKSDITKVYTEHDARLWSYKGSLSYTRKRALHLIQMKASNEKLENWKNNYYRDHNSELDITFIKYHTPTKVLTRTELKTSMEYQLHIDHSDFNPKWSIVAAADYRKREQNVSIYPLYHNQTVKQLIGRMNIKRNFKFEKNQYTVLLGGRFSSGSGTELEEGSYSSSNEQQTSSRSTDFNLHREFEYLTNTCITTNVGFRYSHLLKNNKIRAFASINYELTKATDIEYIKGDTFNAIKLCIGCSF